LRLVTVTHVKIGDPTFGVATDEGEIYATLRTANDAGKEKLEAIARSLSTS